MRWILTYKLSESGEQKPKARAVILGYQDPEYSSRPTFAFSMTRTSRQLLLQYAAWQDMACFKGDVTGAFLQGREYQRSYQFQRFARAWVYHQTAYADCEKRAMGW